MSTSSPSGKKGNMLLKTVSSQRLSASISGRNTIISRHHLDDGGALPCSHSPIVEDSVATAEFVMTDAGELRSLTKLHHVLMASARRQPESSLAQGHVDHCQRLTPNASRF